MNCNTTQARLQRALDAGQPPDAATLRHLTACTACETFRSRLVHLHQTLLAADVSARPLPAAVAARLAAQAGQATAGSPARIWQTPTWRRPGLALAGLAAGILVVAYLSRPSPQLPAPPAASRPASTAMSAETVFAATGHLFDLCTTSVWQVLMHPENRLETELQWLCDDLVSTGRRLLDSAEPGLFRAPPEAALNGG